MLIRCLFIIFLVLFIGCDKRWGHGIDLTDKNNTPSDLPTPTNTPDVVLDELVVSVTDGGDLSKYLIKIDNTGVITKIANQNWDTTKPNTLIKFNNKIYFFGGDSSKATGDEIYSLDTEDNIELVADIDPTNTAIGKRGKAIFNNKLHVTAYSATDSAFKIYTVDTDNNVAKLITSGIDYWNPVWFCVFNTNMYFSAASTGVTAEVFKLTPSNVVSKVSNINSGRSNPSGLVVFMDKLFLVAQGASGYELYEMDAGETFTQVRPTATQIVMSGGAHLGTFGTMLWFVANIAPTGSRFWEMDDSYNLTPYNFTGTADPMSYPIEFINRLYFTGINWSSTFNIQIHYIDNTPSIFLDNTLLDYLDAQDFVVR